MKLEVKMELTHFDEHGNARMVDVSEKDVTSRSACAVGSILVNEEILNKKEMY
jgi:cyclic pyranopterin phosphate synthase